MMLYVLLTILALQGGSKTINKHEGIKPKRLSARQRKLIQSYGKRAPTNQIQQYQDRQQLGKPWKHECVLCNHKVTINI